MAIALVTHAKAIGVASTETTSAIDTSGANFLVVVATHDTASGGTTITDSKSNTWTGRTEVDSGTGLCVQIFDCENATVGSGHTFTITNSHGGSATSIYVAAFSGVASSSAFDQQNGLGTINGTPSVQPGSITPSVNNELVIYGLVQVGTSPSIDSSFLTSDSDAFSGGANYGGGLFYIVQGTAGAVNPTASWASETLSSKGAVIASYKAAPPSTFASFAGSGAFAPASVGSVQRSVAFSGLGTFAPNTAGTGVSVAFSGAGTFAPIAVTGLQRSVAFAGSGAFAPASQSSALTIWVRCPYLASDTIGAKDFTVYEYVSGSEVAVTPSASQFTAIPNITNGWWLVFQVPPNDGFGGGSYIVVFANINSGYRALEVYEPPSSVPTSVKRTKLTSFLESDTIGTATYQLYTLSALNVVTSGSATTTGFIAVSNITNGYAVNYSFTPDSNYGAKRAVEWSG